MNIILPTKRVGSKGRLAPWIVSLLPLNYARIPISRQYRGSRQSVKSRSMPFNPFQARYLPASFKPIGDRS